MKKLTMAAIWLAVISSIAIAANVIISPNMNLPVPVVGSDPGPDWANNINASLQIIDQHNHTPGQGILVPPQGLNINSDLTFQGNNATNLRSTRYTAQGSPLSGGADLGAVYVSGLDLWYNDESGNQVRITNGGNVNAGAGSITGLPSGTASASFSAGTFTWQSATNTPATMNSGPLVVGNTTAGSKQITIAPNSGIGANYNFTLPAAPPASTLPLTMDSSGNVASAATLSGLTLTSPTINGASIGSGSEFNGATVDGTIIGGSVPAAGTFTALTATSSAIFTGATQAQDGLNVTAGGLVVTGSTTLNSTGGNVPHTCVVRSTNGTSNVLSISCNSGEITTGGGCSAQNSNSVLQTNQTGGSSSTPPTGWNCLFSSTSVVAQNASAICCKY